MQEVVAGVYARASEDVLKQRRMIRARRSAAPVTSATIPASNPFAAVKLAPTNIETVPAANPFAGVSLAPPKPAEELPVAEKPTSPGDAAPEKKAENQHDPTGKSEQVKPDSGGFGALASGGSLAFGASSGGFGALSSGSGGGFGGFSAAASNGGGVFAFGSSAAAVKEGEDKTEIAPAAAATGGGEGSNIFGSATASGTALFGIAPKPAAAEFPTECTVSTGEEAERTVFTGDGFFLFEFDSGKQWRERGRGQVRVNVDEAKGQARVVMRQKGNLRLLLNANLWPEMQVTRMDGGSVSLCNRYCYLPFCFEGISFSW